jgi:rare lipoprotein A
MPSPPADRPLQSELPQVEAAPSSKIRGLASWYGRKPRRGKRARILKTANGERFDRNGFTAAHRSLPFGTKVLVRSLASDKWVTVRVNDRGPFSKNRIIDLSYAAARELGIVAQGVAQVEIEILDN